MFSPFDYPGPIAADQLDEQGYPALAEFFREHSSPVGPSLHKTIDEHGHHGKIQTPGPKLEVITNPHFTYASDMGSARGKKKPTFYLGAKGKGYLYGTIKPELHKRLVAELTEPKTELARELPNIPDTEFSPVKGLGGGLKSRFQSGNQIYQVFMKPLDNGHHSFSFEQLTAGPDQDEHGITGAGNAVHVMTQASAHFIHGLRKLQPAKVTFTAYEPSRQKLYDRMVAQLPKYAPEYELESSTPMVGGGIRYFVKRKKVELARGMIDGDEPSGPEGWIDEDGNFHENQPGPYGVRHGDTLTRLGYKNVGEGIRAGLMHLASPDGSQLLGHRSDRQYTPKQLGTLKKLAAKHSLEPAITTTSNGTVTTRSLKLSSVDRLWENIHKDPDARLILADHLEENGEPELAKFMRSKLTSHTSGYDYPSSSYGVVRPDKNQMYRGGKHDHPHIDRVMGGTSVIWLRTKHMEPRHYLQLENLEPNQAHNLAKEISGKLELAAEKAPAGGMVSNNQFYEGGKFLPRALKSIREVRNRKLAGKVKLNRDILAADPRVYADHLEENGYPGLAEFYRDHAQEAVHHPRIMDRWPRGIEESSHPVGIPPTLVRRAPMHHPDIDMMHIYAEPYSKDLKRVKIGVKGGPYHQGNMVPAELVEKMREEVSKKPLGLSRTEDLWNLMAENPHDEGIRGALADHLEENQQPGLAEFFRDHAKPLTDRTIKGVLDRYKGFYDAYISPYNKKADLNHPSISMLRVSTDIQPHRVTLGSPEIGYWHGAPHKELAEKIKSELMSPE